MRSQILFQGKLLVVDPILAKLIGLNESIVLKQIDYWANYNEQAGQYYKDGYYWTTSSVEAWQERDFLFWSVDTIQRTLKKLEQMDLIICGKFNRDKLNHTKWYRVNHDKLKKYEDQYMKIKTQKLEFKLAEVDGQEKTEKGSEPQEKDDSTITAKCPNDYRKMPESITAKCPNRKKADKAQEIKGSKGAARLPQNAQIYYKEEYKDKYKEEGSPPLDPKKEIVDFWNQSTKGTPLKEVAILTDNRKEKLKTRLAEFKPADIKLAIYKVSQSDFCKGQNQRGWMATFDWLIKNQTNLAKAIEGNYDNYTPPTQKDPSKFNYTDQRQTDQMTEAELKDLVGWKGAI